VTTVPSELKYTREHEWVLPIMNGKAVRVGITAFAQKELGDVVFVELPKADTTLQAGEEMGTVESVKAVSEFYAPVDGTITAVNERLDSEPELLNEDPYGDGWIVELTLTDPGSVKDLLTAEQYRSYLAPPEDD